MSPEKEMRKKMKTNRISIGTMSLVLALGAILALPLLASPGGPAGARMGPAQRVLRGALASLDLTQEQKDKIKATLEAEKPGVQAMAEQNRADARALRDLASGTQPDPKAVGEAFLKVQKNREAAKAVREKVQTKIEALLTPAQKGRFQGYIQAAKDAAKARSLRMRGGPPA